MSCCSACAIGAPCCGGATGCIPLPPSGAVHLRDPLKGIYAGPFANRTPYAPDRERGVVGRVVGRPVLLDAKQAASALARQKPANGGNTAPGAPLAEAVYEIATEMQRTEHLPEAVMVIEGRSTGAVTDDPDADPDDVSDPAEKERLLREFSREQREEYRERNLTMDDARTWVGQGLDFINDRFAAGDASSRRAHLVRMAELDLAENRNRREYELKIAAINAAPGIGGGSVAPSSGGSNTALILGIVGTVAIGGALVMMK